MLPDGNLLIDSVVKVHVCPVPVLRLSLKLKYELGLLDFFSFSVWNNIETIIN